mgnify:CR=1 FL=1|jgi:PhoH-like ATPase
MSKNYLIDTSIILDDVTNLFHLYNNGENKVYITDVVLDELEAKKKSTFSSFDVSYMAREFFRLLNGRNGDRVYHHIDKDTNEIIFSKDELTNPNVIPVKYQDDYVRCLYLETKSSDELIPIYVITRSKYKTPFKEHSYNDAKIMEIADDYNYKLVTNDIAFKIKALSKGIDAQSLHRESVGNLTDINFTYHFEDVISYDTDVENEDMNQKIDIYSALDNDSVEGKSFDEIPNNSVIIIEQIYTQESNVETVSGKTGRELYGFKLNDKFEEINTSIVDGEKGNLFNGYLKPINREQKIYLSRLIRDDFRLGVVAGKTGSGKTLMALQGAMKQVESKTSPIDGIVYIRHTIESVEKEAKTGFDKGDKDKKLSNFLGSLYGNIQSIMEQYRESNPIEGNQAHPGEFNPLTQDESTIEFMKKYNIQPYDISKMRGITIKNKFIIVDEAQNLPPNIAKLVGTRIHDSCKTVFIGDWKQIDHPFLTKNRNGLVSLLNLATEENFVFGIKLRKFIRGEVSELFENLF